MLYTTCVDHARRLARDPNGAVADADVLELAQDVYEAYWGTFIRDRLELTANFVTFAANEYSAEASVAVRDVKDLVASAGLPASTTGGRVRVVERDEFEAVTADSENAGATSAYPYRWGMRAQTDSNAPIIAIYPPSAGALTMAAWTYPLLNTLSAVSPGGDLQGTNRDGYSVARLLACEIMLVNGEDPAEIQAVFNLLDQAVKDKFRDIDWRKKPRTSEDKEQ